jgi:carotenoid cleavage dioxygenase-like enzyme
MHSFGLTERFAVLIGQPLVLRPLDLALGRRPFIESFRWEPERGTAFHVIDRRAGRHVGTWHGDPFFCFHTINAFEEGDEIVLDLVAWEDASVIDGLYLDRVRAFGPRMPRNRPLRLSIDLRGEAAVRSQELAPVALEMPRIDYARCNTRPYRYCYGWGAGDGDEWQAGRVVKVDVTSGQTETWEQLGVAPGEPVYVPAPDARDEDDGVLLSLCLDVLQGFSFLLVLDAETLAERGRARLPHHVPLGLHGDFFAGVSAR